MKRLLVITSAIAAFLLPPAVATAQVKGSIGLSGTVVTGCTLGTVSGNDVFDVGVLVDTTTGLLRNDLSAPSKTVAGSSCGTRSVLTISATPMTAQSFNGTPGAGLSDIVNYTATASGWTATAASYSTGGSSNPAASQIQPKPFSGDIVVSVSSFSTAGGNNLRLIADPLYQGTVTITLTVAN